MGRDRNGETGSERRRKELRRVCVFISYHLIAPRFCARDTNEKVWRFQALNLVTGELECLSIFPFSGRLRSHFCARDVTLLSEKIKTR